MKKIKGIYNGYELDDGRRYRLVEEGNNQYRLAIIEDNKGTYALGGTRFYRVKDYIEYLKSLENAFKRN